MEFVSFEDEYGIVETTFFPNAYKRFCDQLDRKRPYLIEGFIEEEFGAITMTVERIVPLDKVPIVSHFQ